MASIPFCIALYLAISCNSTGPQLQQVLAWLPPDTETLTVAQGPFWMSSFLTGDDLSTDHEISVEDLEKQLELTTLGLINFRDLQLARVLEKRQVLLAIEGSRHFRAPAGLGMMPYEGCVLVVFAKSLGPTSDAFMKNSAGTALRMDNIEGYKVVVFQEEREQDQWTLLVAFPRPNVLAVATNRNYLEEVLARMRRPGSERALPNSLAEWKYVNQKARFWGLRHFDRTQSERDPSSPFGGKKSANLPDERAIGITFSCDPKNGKRAFITYLSGDKSILPKIQEELFPALSYPEGNKELHASYRELEPGVVEGTYDLDHSQPVFWFSFVLLGTLGHAVYL